MGKRENTQKRKEYLGEEVILKWKGNGEGNRQIIIREVDREKERET